MKKASDRILKRSVLSVLVTAALYTPQVMAFTKKVNADNSPVTGETVENGTQIVRNGGKTEDITIKNGGQQRVESGGETTRTIIDGGSQYVYGKTNDTTIKSGWQVVAEDGEDNNARIEGGSQSVSGTATGATVYSGVQRVSDGGEVKNTTIKQGGTLQVDEGGGLPPVLNRKKGPPW